MGPAALWPVALRQCGPAALRQCGPAAMWPRGPAAPPAGVCARQRAEPLPHISLFLTVIFLSNLR